jgi:uncharacterized protein YbbC (DUF1343 family)
MKKLILIILAVCSIAQLQAQKKKGIITGADQTSLYLPYLKGKNVGMVVNQTSIIGNNTSIDSLVLLGVQIKKIFGPEHGFRGDAADGATIGDTFDKKTGIPAISLYGHHHKPTPEDLKGIDIMLFDIQDVGVRFYTYVATLQSVMEACAENNMELMILDRPNPHGGYVDGNILDTAYHSNIGMHAVPIVHGMTIAEYAQMINGEGWLKNKEKCRLKIIKVANYTHSMPYKLPVHPSPNLSTQQSVLLYPSICFFEGTPVSLGRGTVFPFQVIGCPQFKGTYSFSFTPVPIPGVSDNPPLKNQTCYGIDLQKYDMNNPSIKGKINLAWLLDAYKLYPDKAHFFNAHFTNLAGGDVLRKQIVAGKTEKEIRASWQPGLNKYKKMRLKYLLYK